MTIRLRKLIGAFALLILVVAWSLLAMGVAQHVLASASALTAGIYYGAAGLGWVIPGMFLIRWMSRPNR